MSLRPEPVAALRAGLRSRLTLVCAPAGYGKTCLVSHVIDHLRARHAWYRLDSLDRDPAIFLEGIVASWRRLHPGFGRRLLRELQARPEERLDDLRLAALFVKECEALGPAACHLVLVLDEYEHAAESQGFNEVLGYLLENAPPGLSFVVATRFEPVFPHRRLAAAGQVTRLDTEDLRFSAAQTAEVLTHHAGRPVARGLAQAVHTAAQGWPTSVVMAATAIRRLAEAADGDSLLSDPRLTQDVYSYLAEQVYLKAPPASREFLLKTCCLTVITPSLAEAVATDTQSHERIRHLVEQGAFTFETRDGRGVRYHPLFRDFLQMRLVREHGPSSLRQVQHMTASALERFGEPARAVELLLDANSPREALDVVGRAGERILDDLQTDTLRAWLERIPAWVARSHPWRAIIAAQVGIRSGDFADALAKLDEAVQALREARDEHGVYQALSVKESALFWKGESEAALAACRDALDHAQTDAQRVHSLLSLACAAVDMRRWDQAEEALARAQAAGAPLIALERERTRALRAHMLYFQGRYRDAQALFSRLDMARLSAQLRISVLNSQGLVYTGLANYDIALHALRRALQEAEELGHELARYMIIDNIAVIEYIAGFQEEAIRKLQSLAFSSEYVREDSLLSFVLCHLGTCLRRSGHLDDAANAYHESASLVDLNRDSYMRLNCEINIALTNFLRGSGPVARLEDLGAEARKRGLVFVENKATLVAARVSALSGEPATALRLLRRCLPLQLREGHYNLLLHELTEEADIRSLACEALGEVSGSAALDGFLARAAESRAALRSAAGAWDDSSASDEALDAPDPWRKPDDLASSPGNRTQDGHPSLTPRENEVLRLMAQGLNNKELSRRLYLAPSTVKTHVNRIFRKLGVTSRVNAVLEYQRLMEPPDAGSR